MKTQLQPVEIQIYDESFITLAGRQVIVRMYPSDIKVKKISKVINCKNKNDSLKFFLNLKERMESLGYVRVYDEECFSIQYDPNYSRRFKYAVSIEQVNLMKNE